MRLYNCLSRYFGYFASYPFPHCIQMFINKAYVKLFDIDLNEHDPIEHYQTLNDLFTRSLVKNRDFKKNIKQLLAPCDGKVIALGNIQDQMILQVKGKLYNICNLIGENLSSQMAFCNFYLSPKNYHRFHAPIDMQIVSITYFPGTLLSVRESVLKRVDNVFTQNERVVIKAIDPYGQALFFVAIGAMNVGKIVIYAEPRIATNANQGYKTYFYNNPIICKQGQEIGYFKMGSSIVLLHSSWDFCVNESAQVRFGDCVGIKGDHDAKTSQD